MALKWVDGFEQYGSKTHMLEGVGGAAAWSEVDTRWTLITTNPATQTYHMRLTEGSNVGQQNLRRVWGVSSQVVGLGYRFQVEDLPTVDLTGAALCMADIRDASNGHHIVIVMGTDGSVIAVRGADLAGGAMGGTVLGRSDPCIAAGGYHHFEVKAKIDNSVGYVEVRINEVTVLNITGVDTQNTANATAAQFSILQSGNAGQSGPGYTTYDVDDIYTWDDDDSDAENTVVDWIGDKGCYYLKPNADTAESDWILSTGATSYSLLDEVPPSGTDYINDASGAARTVVQVEALPENISEVIAMMPVIYARKEESGTVNIRGGVVVSGDESYTPTNSPSTEYAYMEPGPKTIDPNTGVAWANDANPDLLIERTA